jgi:Flp pilus assembly secretin CpaC
LKPRTARPQHEDAAVTLSTCVRTIALVVSCLASVGVSQAASPEEVAVMLDQAKIMRLPDKASTIVIGNPMVADGTLQTGGLLVVTGKGYGTTNLIALDAKGVVLGEYTLKVTAPRDGMVTVYRGLDRETWSCQKQCERTVVLGDAPTYFNTAVTQAGARNTASAGAPVAAPER